MKLRSLALLLTLVGITTLMALSALYIAAVEDYNRYKSESSCVKQYIKHGYRRVQIVTGNGKCWFIKKT